MSSRLVTGLAGLVAPGLAGLVAPGLAGFVAPGSTRDPWIAAQGRNDKAGARA